MHLTEPAIWSAPFAGLFLLAWLIAPHIQGKLTRILPGGGIIFPRKHFPEILMTGAISWATVSAVEALMKHRSHFWYSAMTVVALYLLMTLLLPGPIEMTRYGIRTDSMWSGKRRSILFSEVTSVEQINANTTCVTGTNGNVITHTRWHAGMKRFRKEMQARANQPDGMEPTVGGPDVVEAVEAS